jgi:hypothetical protein
MPNHPNARSNRAILPRLRSRLFGSAPLLLKGEDAAAYEDLFAGIHAAVKPVDTVDEMFVADVVELEWEVLRWRRLKSSLLRMCQCDALKEVLERQLDYDQYLENFAKRLSRTLEDCLPRDQVDTAEPLAQACARNDPDAEDKVGEILQQSTTSHTIEGILGAARVGKAEELAQKYVRREPEAIKLVDEILAGASVDIDDLTAEKVCKRFADIEQFDRRATIAENRRDASLREIDRRRSFLGEALRRSVKEVEDAEFEVVETTRAKRDDAA